MRHTFTHEGVRKNSSFPVFDRSILLRETKLFWICQIGRKFRKTTGKQPNILDPHPDYIDVETVKALETQESFSQAVAERRTI